jgi:lycopene cyclase domain-containing protein
VKEYTLLAAVFAGAMVALDHIAGTHLVRRGVFWVFMLVMMCFKLVVNGWLTWRPIVIYGERFQIGVRIGTIPLEDFLFGFAMILLTLVVWERYRIIDHTHNDRGTH